MFLNELLSSDNTGELEPVLKNCQQFLKESARLPLLKNLPIDYKDLHKVKVRQRKKANDLSETFNQAFQGEHSKIFQRAVFANGQESLEKPIDETQEPFYVFPIDGYKFMYCKEVKNSNSEYRQVFDALFEQFGNDKDQATTVIADLLKFTYTRENLNEGISLGSEIIIYNIPYYFAVRVSQQESYNKLLTSLHIN